MSGLVSGGGVQRAALQSGVAAAPGGGAMSGAVAVARRWAPWGPGGTRRGVQVQAAGGEEAGAGPHPCGCVGVGVVGVQPAVAEVPHRLGVAQRAVALGQAQVGGGAFGRR